MYCYDLLRFSIATICYDFLKNATNFWIWKYEFFYEFFLKMLRILKKQVEQYVQGKRV